MTIVGVARDAKYGSLTEVTPAFAYFPVRQHWITSQILLVRATLPPVSLAAAIQGAVLGIDPALPRPVVTTLRESTSIVLLPQRIATIVTAAMGGVGLLLATVGLYGIMSFGVGRRSREIGLRMALGADRRSVLRLIVREGMRLALVGVAVGIVLSVAATRLLSSLLLGVSPLDPLTFVGMSALFAAVALLASYLPARRAAGADPMAVLRVD
jgi:ABC-type antimicrobial peptide transport system permease subunit